MKKEPETTRPKATTKKAFIEGAALVYKLLKKYPEMSIHVEVHRYVGKPLYVRYWIYSYKHTTGKYAAYKDLEKTFKKISEGVPTL